MLRLRFCQVLTAVSPVPLELNPGHNSPRSASMKEPRISIISVSHIMFIVHKVSLERYAETAHLNSG